MPSHDEVLLGMQLANQVLAAIHGRNTVYAGRTWADFKRAIESCGVRDDDVFASVEYGVGQLRFSSGYIHIEWNEQDEVEIRELSPSEVR